MYCKDRSANTSANKKCEVSYITQPSVQPEESSAAWLFWLLDVYDTPHGVRVALAGVATV